MLRRRDRRAAAVSVAIMTIAHGAPAFAQINSRTHADPGSDAKTARLLSRADLVGSKAGDTLKQDDLSDFAVTTDCGPVQIGGTTAPETQSQVKSLLRSQAPSAPENSTVIRGDTVVICRR